MVTGVETLRFDDGDIGVSQNANSQELTLTAGQGINTVNVSGGFNINVEGLSQGQGSTGPEDNVIDLSVGQYGLTVSGTYLIDRFDQDSGGNDVAVLVELTGTSATGYTRTSNTEYLTPGYTTDLQNDLASDALTGSYVNPTTITAQTATTGPEDNVVDLSVGDYGLTVSGTDLIDCLLDTSPSPRD